MKKYIILNVANLQKQRILYNFAAWNAVFTKTYIEIMELKNRIV